MLVSAFAGRDHVLAAYQHAVAEEYRFFSFGDAMFLRGPQYQDPAISEEDIEAAKQRNSQFFTQKD